MKPRALNQSLSSYINQHQEEIENLISLGVYQDSICQELTALGFTLTLGGFKKALARARQRRRIEQGDPLIQVGQLAIHATGIKGKRLSPNEFALLERQAETPALTAQNSAQNALVKLSHLKLTANEMAEITALAERISTRAADGL